MKKISLFFVFSIIFIGLQAQITGYDAKTSDTVQGKVDAKGVADVNMKIDQAEATFPGGNDSLFRLIYAQLQYTEEAIEAKLQGEMLISFNVNFDGKVSRVNIISGVGYGMDEKVTEIIKNLIFDPARMNGVPFRSQVFYTIPIQAHH